MFINFYATASWRNSVIIGVSTFGVVLLLLNISLITIGEKEMLSENVKDLKIRDNEENLQITF
jgi:predicted phage tail protein